MPPADRGRSAPRRGEPPATAIRAAGVVAIDDRGRVVVVHRPRREDWSLPKGKLDPGEHRLAAAVRECAEETGLRVALDAPLGTQHYIAGGQDKVVHYWRARIRSAARFTPNAEVDAVRRVSPEELPALLSYPDDLATVQDAVLAGATTPLLVLRHATAYKRADWAGCGDPASEDDGARPLAPQGLAEADVVAELLDAYGIEHVVSSPARRCRQTVEPYAARAGVRVVLDDRLAEGEPRDPERIGDAVRTLTADPRRVALCTHRLVLPALVGALAEQLLGRGGRRARRTALDPHLAPAELLVLHRDDAGRIVAVELHATGER